MTCQYIYGDVKEIGVGQTFDVRVTDYYFGAASSHLVPLTRVTLTTDAQRWDRDLELVQGTTAVGTVALAVTGWLGFWGPLWSALLGAGLGLFIPWITIARIERRRTDWLAGALTGAAIVLSISASLIVFGIWRSRRFGDGPRKPSRWLVLPALAAVHFLIVVGVCRGLMTWIDAVG